MIEGLSPNSRIQVILIPGFAGFDALGQLEYIERSPQNVCADESVCDSTSESHPFLKARINRETAEAQLPTRRTIARKGMVIATTFPSSRRECRSSRAVPSDVSRMPETFLSAGVYTLCAEHCESGRCRWISGRKNGFFSAAIGQIRCDPDFQQVYCGTLRKKRVREGPPPSTKSLPRIQASTPDLRCFACAIQFPVEVFMASKSACDAPSVKQLEKPELNEELRRNHEAGDSSDWNARPVSRCVRRTGVTGTNSRERDAHAR